MVGPILLGAAILHSDHGGGLRLHHRTRLCRKRHALRGKSKQDANQQQKVNKRFHCTLK